MLGLTLKSRFFGPIPAVLASVLLSRIAVAQTAPKTTAPLPAIQHWVGSLGVAIRSDSQTLERLSPASEPRFDFLPSDREAERTGDGYVQLGDIHLRLRAPGGPWQDFASER